MEKAVILDRLLHPDGWRVVLGLVAGTLALFWLWQPLGWLGLVATIWGLASFRDPVRAVPVNLGLVVSPADGIVAVDRAIPPPELKLGEATLTRLVIEMPVLGPHVLRAPIAGRLLVEVTGRPFGKSETGQALSIEIAEGRFLTLVLTAGPPAGRVALTSRAAETLRTGQRLGLIRFGGRVALDLPEGLVAQVASGQTMIAGETVIALVGQDSPARAAQRD